MGINTWLAAGVAALALVAPSAFGQDVWDSDGDGYDDNDDNCTLVYNPDQKDADRDYNGNLCDADFNNDGIVNAIDLGIMRANFFTTASVTDINSDGITNPTDLGLFKSMFFTQPGPTGTDPDQPPCTCYFSNDCPTGSFCNYGPGGFATEDICVWRDIKPNGVVDAGCSRESNLGTGAWTPDICDGVCQGPSAGSPIGLENRAAVIQNIRYWGEAMINPSEAGGGPVDEAIAAQAQAMSFNVANTPLVLGRQTADALALAAGEPFHDYFCHWEGHPDDPNQPVVDLSGNDCLVTSARLTIEALTSAIERPGSAAAIMKEIVNACPDWQQMFGTNCAPGPGALRCAAQSVEAQAQFLRTPPVTASDEPDAVDILLGNARL